MTRHNYKAYVGGEMIGNYDNLMHAVSEAERWARAKSGGAITGWAIYLDNDDEPIIGGSYRDGETWQRY